MGESQLHELRARVKKYSAGSSHAKSGKFRKCSKKLDRVEEKMAAFDAKHSKRYSDKVRGHP